MVRLPPVLGEFGPPILLDIGVMTMNIYSLFASRFTGNLSQVCMETDTGRSHDYSDVERVTARLARLFTSLGARRGDRVVAQVDKSVEALFVYPKEIEALIDDMPGVVESAVIGLPRNAMGKV